mmetsp:Transcript_21575/g.53364  ORF Transcript_21575/g.53364 Transcript_21575/m.53364 type:complete len:115 (+) Transcript_21575:2662-3006(+)
MLAFFGERMTDSSFSQKEKAPLPMVFSVDGNRRCSSPESAKAAIPIFTSPSLNSNFAKLLQPQKARSPISVTEEGTSISTRDVQPVNNLLDMTVRPTGNLTYVKRLRKLIHSKK